MLVSLLFEGAVAEFAEPVEEHGFREGVACFSFVEASG